jgi:hypothetical protein
MEHKTRVQKDDQHAAGTGSGDTTYASTVTPEHNWNELNELTLSVMANRTKYDRCKKTLANTSDAVQETFRKEKLYYKERILNMTRDLFHERCENDTINEAHQEYIKVCIEYLKWNDITDMVSEDARNELQEKIMRTRIPEPVEEPPLPSPTPSLSSLSAHPPPPPPPSSSSSMNNIMSFANKICMRKKTIDDFIVLKPRDDVDINTRLPKVRDYQSEITKRVLASEPKTGDDSNHDADSFD